MEFVEQTEAAIKTWQAITPPNRAAHRFIADLAGAIGAFEALREQMAFEDEPSSFEAALRETKA
jgi:hypothetical protein